MYDAGATIKSGVLSEGNLFWPGSLRSCLEIGAGGEAGDADGWPGFSGKFCFLARSPVRMAACFPDTCTDDDVEIIVDMNSGARPVSCETRDQKWNIDTLDGVTIGISVFLGTLVIASTAIDVMSNVLGKEMPKNCK